MRRFYYLLAIVVFAPTALAQTTLTMAQLQASAMQKIRAANATSGELTSTQQAEVARWLQGPVSAQVIALKTDAPQGLDEYEIGITLPFRSPKGHELDTQQQALNTQLADINQQRIALNVSGIVRHAVWQLALAQAEQQRIEQKSALIAQLDDTLKSEFNRQEIDKIAYLEWQQQRLSLALERQQILAAYQQALHYYVSVTGEDRLPDNLEESLLARPEDALYQHPELKWLQLNAQQADLTLAMNDQSLSPWTMGVVARQFRGPTDNENMLGVSVNVPLSSSGSSSANNDAQWRQTRLSLEEALANQYLALGQQLAQALSDYRQQQTAFNIAQQQAQLAVDISALYHQQPQSLPLAWRLSQQLKQIDLQLAPAIYALRVGEAIAKIHQIAGVTL